RGQNLPRSVGLYRGTGTGHPQLTVVAGRRLTAWVHRVNEMCQSVGVARGPGFHHPLRRACPLVAVCSTPSLIAARGRDGRGQSRPSVERPDFNYFGATLMFISYRFVLLAVAGFIPVFFWPGWGTIFLLLAGLAVVLVIELALTPSPRAVKLTRSENKNIRLAQPLEVWVDVTNHARRTMRGQIRDGWQPAAHDTQAVHRL